MRKLYRIIALLLMTLYMSVVAAQNSIRPDSPKYEQLKKEGKLDMTKVMKSSSHDHPAVLHPPFQRTVPGVNHTMTAHAQCNCMIPRDTSFQVVPFTNGVPPEYRNDDGSSPLISLPFSFNFYGTPYTDVYINNNGNISFNAPYFTFSPVGFPSSQYFMIAPFWGDVDTRVNFTSGTTNSGIVWYRLTSTSLIVQWDSVGYYGTHDDLLNTFQLIITDGTDPILPPGNNVDFCYGNMSWTTGDASLGQNGFGGYPATVGANAGNGNDYIQFGRFDGPGTGYDGPFGNNDSVDFLDNQNFIFNTNTLGGVFNIPPIVHGLVVCDTITICASDTAFVDTIPLSLEFLSPEMGQITTITTTFTGPGTFTVLNNTPGPTAHIDAQLILTGQAAGLNSVTFYATDNGTPVATDSLNVTIKIDTFPYAPPVIVGPNYYCVGSNGVTLHLPGNFVTYLWSDGTTGTDSLHVQTGTYNVEVTDPHGCRAKTPAFPVWIDDPNATIGGVTAICGQGSAHLTTTQHYASYNWSTGSTADTITVGTGNYYVIVTDIHGCKDTTATLNVVVHPFPTAAFAYYPNTAAAGDTIHFTDQSSAGSGTIVAWHWNFGESTDSISNLQNPTHVFAALGTYPVTLTVTQSDGCINTIKLLYTGEPDSVIAPNIMTPNNDGKNDAFFVKNLEFYPNTKLEIFNRWGRKVYESSNYQNDWKGGDLVDGVYYYVLKVPDKDAKKGTVTLKR